MDPAQMEGFIVNYYEYHFLYITGIEHVEKRDGPLWRMGCVGKRLSGPAGCYGTNL
jgi:hypothetical protein